MHVYKANITLNFIYIVYIYLGLGDNSITIIIAI